MRRRGDAPGRQAPGRRLRQGAAALVVALTGCTSPLIEEPPWSSSLTPVGTFSLDAQGRTKPLTITRDPRRPYTLLRVRAVDPDGPRCLQLEEATSADGTRLIPAPLTAADFGLFCVHCDHRAHLGHGVGLFILPNNGEQVVLGAQLTVRVAARDCTSRVPLRIQGPLPRVRIERADLLLPPANQQGRLVLHLLWTRTSGGFGSADPRDHPVVGPALMQAEQLLAPANLSLSVRASDLTAAVPDPLEIGRGDLSALDRLAPAIAAAVGAAAVVPVVVAGCIRQRDDLAGRIDEPQGLVARLPGGLPDGRHFDGIVLKGRGCSAKAPPGYWNAASLGRVLAHELGHYLGLYHSVESSGLTDHLDDTTAENLMHHQPQVQLALPLSPGQVRVMRSHPAVLY